MTSSRSKVVSRNGIIIRKPQYSADFCKPLCKPKRLIMRENEWLPLRITIVFFASREVLPLRGQTLTIREGKERVLQAQVNFVYELEFSVSTCIPIVVELPGGVEYTFTAYRSGRIHVNLSLEDAEKIAKALDAQQPKS